MARLPSVRVSAAFVVVALALLIAVLLLVCTGDTAETPGGPRSNTAQLEARAGYCVNAPDLVRRDHAGVTSGSGLWA